ncbi:MAG: Dabb family protein [Desulfovibrio sp.]|uniref:Dabb family protein n=1 Tax=Desulfovibrio sp. 7SRBS1 TaxID=3378064 RepID=UPI003B415B98
MIKHIVMWRVKDSAEGMDKAGIVAEMKKRLEALKGEVPGAIELELGANFNTSDGASDAVLYSTFNTREELDAYQVHPAHQAVVGFISSVATERRVVDYEV